MLKHHKIFWKQKEFVYNVALGIGLLIVALCVSQFANFFTFTHASNNVTDLFLDNLPTVNVHLIFSEGAVLFILALAIVLILEPKYIPFSLKSVAVFYLIRSFFLILTHIAAPANGINIDPTDFIARLDSPDGLFFSAHTGLPFLMAFVFWEQKWMRNLFFICTAIGGAAVLLGHLHYSIDVFSALFISFGIYHICKHLFKKDYKLSLAA